MGSEADGYTYDVIKIGDEAPHRFRAATYYIAHSSATQYLRPITQRVCTGSVLERKTSSVT